MTTNVPLSTADNVIVIEDDDVSDKSDVVGKVQECKMEKIEESDSNPAVQRHVPGTSETQTDQILVLVIAMHIDVE